MIRAYGIELSLPVGYEGRIYKRIAAPGERTNPIAQVASFPFPARVADFGNGAVTVMSPEDVLVILAEYDRTAAETALFAADGFPRTLGFGDFSTIRLRRGINGHSGAQQFFQVEGRPFSLYVVMGRHTAHLVDPVNEVLGGITIEPAGVPAWH